LTTFQDKERVSKIQGLINHLVTFMSDSLALITGPYENLLTIEEVLEKNLILYVSLNINVNADAVTALGRILLQNLQLTLGQRYAKTGHGVNHDFVSILMDEFAPFAYQNFSAHSSNRARGKRGVYVRASELRPTRSHRFWAQGLPHIRAKQLLHVAMKDDKTTEQYRKEGGEMKHERLSVHVEKGGILTGDKYEEQGTGSRSDYYDLQIRDEQLKRLPAARCRL
jgi:hypothetical protein